MPAVMERETETAAGVAVFAATRRDLSRAVQAAGRVVSANSILDVLKNVLIEAAADVVRVSANNLEISLETTVPAQVASPGAFTVHAGDLQRILSALPEGDVSVRMEGERAVFQSGPSKVALATIDADLMPPIPGPSELPQIALDGELLRELLEDTVGCASKESPRPILCAVYLEVEAGLVRAVATDTHKLAKSERKAETRDSSQTIIPVETVRTLLGLLDDGSVEVIVEPNQISFRSANSVLTSRVIEGKYPSYQRVIPSEFAHIVEFDQALLLGALRRLGSVARRNLKEGECHELKFHFADDGLLISAESELGRSEERFSDALLEVPELRIAVACNNLEMLVKSARTPRVTLNFNEPGPLLVREVGGEREWLGLVVLLSGP